MRSFMGAFIAMTATLAAIASANAAATPLAGTIWRSDACGLTIALQADGGAAFTSSTGRQDAAWRTEGEQLIVELIDDLREFRGEVVAPDRIEGVHSWTDVAGMIGQKSCVLMPKSG